jgi:hypothetical protein
MSIQESWPKRRLDKGLVIVAAFLETPSSGRASEEIGMAEMEGSLWKYNLCKVLVVDVTDDYRLHQPPLPSTYYPVLQELWLPRHKLDSRVAIDDLIQGYLYDWHERPMEESGEWYVGVVDSTIMQDPAFKALFEMCPPAMAS